MPRHNRPDLAELLRREFSTDPPGGFDTVSPEIVPVAIVADALSTQRAGISPASGFVDRTAAAGQTHHAALFNPAASGIIVELHTIIATADQDDVITAVVENGLDTGILPTAASAPGYYLEVPRVRNTNATIHSASAVPSLVAGIWRVRILAKELRIYRPPSPIILKANSSVHIQMNVAAGNSQYTFMWIERPIAADVP